MKESGDPRIDVIGTAIFIHPLGEALSEDQCWELAQEVLWALENNAYEIAQPSDTQGAK